MTDDNYVCILLDAALPTDTNDYLAWSFSVPMNKRIRVSCTEFGLLKGALQMEVLKKNEQFVCNQTGTSLHTIA
jgi:hypothetical protein